jgi:DNA polymerase III delta prime subunit
MKLDTLKIKKITKSDRQARVYDLSVDETHNFFVGQKQILTSNCDGVTGEGQRALRNVMEEYAANTRFILTANYKHKIIPAVQSRCVSLNFNHNIQDVIKHCFSILKKENIVVPEDQKPLFVELVKHNFPDFRKIINELQKNSTSGTLCIVSQATQNEFVKDIFDRLKENPFECRKFYIQNESTFQSDYHNLMKNMVQYVYSWQNEPKKSETILVITEYMYRHAFVVDQEINFFALILQIAKL